MKHLATFILILATLVCNATNVRFNIGTITGGQTNLSFTVQGLVMPFGSTNFVVTGYPMRFTPTSGTITTNLVAGTYRLTFIGPSPAQTVDFAVTNSASTLDVSDLASWTLSKFTASQYYTIDQSDARYALKAEAASISTNWTEYDPNMGSYTYFVTPGTTNRSLFFIRAPDVGTGRALYLADGMSWTANGDLLYDPWDAISLIVDYSDYWTNDNPRINFSIGTNNWRWYGHHVEDAHTNRILEYSDSGVITLGRTNNAGSVVARGGFSVSGMISGNARGLTNFAPGIVFDQPDFTNTFTVTTNGPDWQHRIRFEAIPYSDDGQSGLLVRDGGYETELLRITPGGLVGNGSGLTNLNSTTTTVAASDSSAAAKLAAQYVCSGTADEATIRTALAAASGSLVFAPGTYRLSGSVTCAAPVYIYGPGAVLTNTVVGFPALTISGTNITIRGLRFEGLYQTFEADATCNGIYGAVNSESVLVDSCQFNGLYRGVFGESNCVNWTVSNCRMAGNASSGARFEAPQNLRLLNNFVVGTHATAGTNFTRVGLWVSTAGASPYGGQGVLVSGNWVENTYKEGIIVHGARAEISGNWVTGAVLDANIFGIKLEGTPNSWSPGEPKPGWFGRISGNHVWNCCKGVGATWDSANPGMGVGQFQIDHNEVSQVTGHPGYGIHCFGTTTNQVIGALITDNYVHDITNYTSSDGILVDNPVNTTVSRNHLYNMGRYGIRLKSYATLFSSNAVVSGNLIEKSYNTPIRIDSQSVNFGFNGLVVRDNRCVMDGWPGSGFDGIFIDSVIGGELAMANSAIMGNVGIAGRLAMTTGYQLGGTNLVVSGNIVVGRSNGGGPLYTWQTGTTLAQCDGDRLPGNTLFSDTSQTGYFWTNQTTGGFGAWVPNTGLVYSNSLTGVCSLLSGADGGINIGGITSVGPGDILATNNIYVGASSNITLNGTAGTITTAGIITGNGGGLSNLSYTALGSTSFTNSAPMVWTWTGAIGVTNDTTLTTVWSNQVPGGVIGARGTVEIFWSFAAGAAGAQTNFMAYVYFGSTAVADWRGVNSASGARTCWGRRVIFNANSEESHLSDVTNTSTVEGSAQGAEFSSIFNTTTNFPLTIRIQHTGLGQTNWLSRLRIVITRN